MPEATIKDDDDDASMTRLPPGAQIHHYQPGAEVPDWGWFVPKRRTDGETQDTD